MAHSPHDSHDYSSLVPAPHPSFMFNQVVYHDIDEWARAVLSKYPISQHANLIKRWETATDDARQIANKWTKTAITEPTYEGYASTLRQSAASMKREVKALAHTAVDVKNALKQNELRYMTEGLPSSVHHRSGLYGGSRRRNKKSKNSKKRSNKSHRRK